MKRTRRLHSSWLLIPILGLTPFVVPLRGATNPSFDGIQVSMIATAEAKHGHNLPDLAASEVLVREDRQPLRVVGMTKLAGADAGLELFLVIDDGSNTVVASQLKDLRGFVKDQPSSTLVGVAYMRDGTVTIARDLTSDHNAAAAALRIPMGASGAFANPYWSLEDLLKRWPAGERRREVVLITSGIDRSGPWTVQSPYVEAAADAAARVGVIVYCIYTPAEGHWGHTPGMANWGQFHLSQLAEETGGEAYYLGTGAPVSFTSYLSDIATHLARQYHVTFEIAPHEKGGFRQIRLGTEYPDVELIGAAKVWVGPGLK